MWWASVWFLVVADLASVILLPVAAWKGSTGHSGNELTVARGVSAFNLSDFQVMHSVPSWNMLLGSRCWHNLLLRSCYHPFIASGSCWGILLTRSRAHFLGLVTLYPNPLEFPGPPPLILKFLFLKGWNVPRQFNSHRLAMIFRDCASGELRSQ